VDSGKIIKTSSILKNYIKANKMKKLFISSLIFLFFPSTFSQINIREVKFIAYASNVSDSEFVCITGNDSLLGNWNPNAIKLFKVNDSTWSKSFKFDNGKKLEYKFTKGSWEHEALDDDGLAPSNSFLKVINDTIITTRIKKWGRAKVRVNHGQITGTIRYHLQFEGKGLKPRDIIVWLPPGYENNVEKRYPVFYMNDGQNVFDPATSSFGYDWRADEVADSLIKVGAINEIIIVGIYNTEDRRQEYIYTNLGYTYMDFVVNRLKPFIDKEYRTLPDKKNTAICGSSAGGLISFMIAWRYPEIFSKAACLSPAFKRQELNYVDTIVNYSGKKKNIKFYIDNGGIGIDSELLPGTNEMITALQNKGYESCKDIIWYVDKNASHFETAWAERIWRPLVFFFGRN